MCQFMRYVMISCIFVLCFFFFKQKTAYEMRISDWSSDVCSSDLHWRLEGAGRQGGQGQGPDLADAGRHRGEAALHGGGRGRNGPGAPRLCAVYARGARIHVCGPPLEDRKSVVSETSVLVRVDLVGSRILKKKHSQR